MSEASDWLEALAADLGIAEEEVDIKAEDEQNIANAMANGVDMDRLRELILDPNSLGEHSTGRATQATMVEQALERLTKEE